MTLGSPSGTCDFTSPIVVVVVPGQGYFIIGQKILREVLGIDVMARFKASVSKLRGPGDRVLGPMPPEIVDTATGDSRYAGEADR